MKFGEVFDKISSIALENAADPANAVPSKGMRLPKWSSEVIIKVQVPDQHSKMTAPFLYVESRYGRVPWIATMIELFATDWELVIS